MISSRSSWLAIRQPPSFNFGEVGMVNPGKRQTLASAPTASQLVSRLTENLIVRFQAPAAGVLDLRQADGGLMQLMNAEGETVTGTSTTQLLYPMTAQSSVYIYANQEVQLQFVQEPMAPIVPGAMTNQAMPVDVNQDARITALDALLVINELNARQSSIDE